MKQDVAAIITCMTDSERPFLQEALDSVYNQTVPCEQIFVVVRDTNAWIDKHTHGPQEITVLKLPPSYAGAARNAATRLVTTEYIAFLDGDDLWAPTKIERQRECLERTRGNFVGVDHLLVSETGKRFAYARAKNIPMPSSWMVRRSTMLEHPFDQGISNGTEDGEWWVRTYHVVPKVRIPETLIHYRVRGTSLSSDSPSKKRKLAVAKLASNSMLRPFVYLASLVVHRVSRADRYVPAKGWAV